jgi:hypothetical protein
MEDVESGDAAGDSQALVSLLERPVPPQMRRMPSLYMTTPAFGGIRSDAITFATITGMGSSSGGEPS